MSFLSVPDPILGAILDLCRDFRPVLRAVCRRWRGAAPGAPPNSRLCERYRDLACFASPALLEWVLGCFPPRCAGRDSLLRVAMYCGRESAARMVRDSVGPELLRRAPCGVLLAAAAGGHPVLIRLAYEWGDKVLEHALPVAALRGDIVTIRELGRMLPPREFGRAWVIAARRLAVGADSNEVADLLLAWGGGATVRGSGRLLVERIMANTANALARLEATLGAAREYLLSNM